MNENDDELTTFCDSTVSELGESNYVKMFGVILSNHLNHVCSLLWWKDAVSQSVCKEATTGL